MTRPQAIKIALACIEQECKRLAVDANMFDMGLADYPYAGRASARRKELREAARIIQEPLQMEVRL